MAKLKIACWNLSNFPFGSVPPETKDQLPVNVNKVNSIVGKIKAISPDIAILTGVDRSTELAQPGNKAIWKDAGFVSFVATNRTQKEDLGVNGGTAILTKLFIRGAWEIDVRKSSDKWSKFLELPDTNPNVRAADTPILVVALKLSGDRTVYVYASTFADSSIELEDFPGKTTLVQAERDKSAKYQQAKRLVAAKAILADIRLKKLDPLKDFVVIGGTLMTPFTYASKGYPEFADEMTIKTLIGYKPIDDKPAYFFHIADPANTGTSSDQSYKTSPGAYRGADIDYEHVILSEGMRSPAPSWKLENSEYEAELYNEKKKYGLGEVVKLSATREATKAAVLYQRTSFSPGTAHVAADYTSDHLTTNTPTSGNTTSATVAGVTMLVTAGRYELPTETPTTKWRPYYPWYRDGQPMKKGYRFTFKHRVYEVKQDISEADYTNGDDVVKGPKVSAVDISKVKIPSSTRNMVVVTTGVDA